MPTDSQLWLVHYSSTVATLAAKASIAYSLLYGIRIAYVHCFLGNRRRFLLLLRHSFQNIQFDLDIPHVLLTRNAAAPLRVCGGIM